MRVFSKGSFLVGLICSFLCTSLFTACGADSSSSSDSENSENNARREIEVDSKVSKGDVFVTTVYDFNSDEDVMTVQFGMYQWMLENVKYNAYGARSMCYDDESSNCSEYGRLFQSYNAYRACPTDFSVPTKDDWRELDRYRSKYAELDSLMNFPHGGYCKSSMDGLKCVSQGNVGYYLASDSSVVAIEGTEDDFTFQKEVEESYYLLRCLSYTYIVATQDDLPLCDSVSQQSLKLFYVMKDKSNYRCVNNHWVDDFNNDCSHVSEGMFSVYNDSMYICKNDEWRLANISESRDSCTAANDSTTYLFNGKYYACEDSSWRRFTAVEDALGYCKSISIGKIDTMLIDTDTLYYEQAYTCSANGWRKTILTDYIGVCDSTHMFQQAKYENIRYVCRGVKWEPFTSIELEIGICSPKKQGHIDTVETNYYVCDSSEWRYATRMDYLGECTPKRINQTAFYGWVKYICLEDGWYEMDNLEADMGLCTEKREGEIDSTESGYAYICDGGWREVKAADIGGVCDSTKYYKIIDVNSRKYYCLSSSWYTLGSLEEEIGFCTESKRGKTASVKNGSTYYCGENGWTKMDPYEVVLGMCTSALEGTTKKNVDTVFVCSNGSWERASRDMVLGTCDREAAGQTKTYLGTMYGCRDSAWVAPDSLDKKLGFCSEKILREVVLKNGQYYRCGFYKWTAISAVIGALGTCDENSYGKYKKASDGIMYTCASTNLGWTRVDNMYIFYGECGTSNDGKTVVFNNEEYVCDLKTSTGWNKLDSLDKAHGTYCGYSSVGDTVTYHDVHYVCKHQSYSYKWTKSTDREYMGYCTASREGHTMFNGANTSKCTGGKWVGVTKTFTDSRDSKKYNYVTIDGLDFMSQNLNYAGVDSTVCVEGSTTNCDAEGRLYSQTSAAKACPSGWRLPDSTELHDMLDTLYKLNKYYAFYGDGWNLMPYDTKAFTDTTGWHDENLYGLNITPTGYEIAYLQNGMDPMITRMARSMSVFYWTSSGDYWGRGRPFGFYDTQQYQSIRVIGMAIRCVR